MERSQGSLADLKGVCLMEHGAPITHPTKPGHTYMQVMAMRHMQRDSSARAPATPRAPGTAADSACGFPAERPIELTTPCAIISGHCQSHQQPLSICARVHAFLQASPSLSRPFWLHLLLEDTLT